MTVPESGKLGRPSMVDRTLPCVTTDCPRMRNHVNGLCSACYQRLRLKGTTDYAVRVSVLDQRQQCVEGCGRYAVYLDGKCSACYQKERNAQRRLIAQEALQAADETRERQLAEARRRSELSERHDARESAWWKYFFHYGDTHPKEIAHPPPALLARHPEAKSSTIDATPPNDWQCWVRTEEFHPDMPNEERAVLQRIYEDVARDD